MGELTFQDLANEAMKRWPQIDQPRMARAIRLAEGNHIYRHLAEPGTWEVQSEKEYKFYVVRPGKHSCTCTDTQFNGNICKHRLAVWLRTEYQNRTGRIKPLGNRQEILKELGY